MRFILLLFCLMMSLEGFCEDPALPELRKPNDCGGRRVDMPSSGEGAAKEGAVPGEKPSREQQEAEKNFLISSKDMKSINSMLCKVKFKHI